MEKQMTNEKRNAAITAKIERYTQEHTATPELAQEAIERIAMTNDNRYPNKPLTDPVRPFQNEVAGVMKAHFAPDHFAPGSPMTNDKDSAVDALMQIQVITSNHSGWIEQKLETRWETVKQIHAIASDGIAKALRQPTQSDALQADIEAMESILWVDTIIDDQEAIAKAFARHYVANAPRLTQQGKPCD